MCAVAVRVQDVEIVDTPTLDELAAIANNEHDLAVAAAESAIAHAVSAGEALIEARRQVPNGKWTKWLEENWKASETIAYIYVRVATFKDHIPDDAGTLHEARAAIRSLPYLFRGRTDRGFGDEIRNEVKRLHNDGLSLRSISEVVGVHKETVHRWVNPERAKQSRQDDVRRMRQRRAEREALKRQERDAAARKAGGGVSEAYSLIRKLAQVLDGLERDGETVEIRAAGGSSTRMLYKIEDTIVSALGCTVRSSGMP